MSEPANAKATRQGGPALNEMTCEASPTEGGHARPTNLWMPLWIGDYLADTMELTCQQHGALLLLLMAYWRNQGPLRCDPDCLRRICRLTPRQFKADWPAVSAFFRETGGFLVHHKCDRELAEWRAKKDRFKQRASRAATERWGRRSDASSIPQAMLEQCASPSPSPIQSIHPCATLDRGGIQ